ncbi:MAG: hypothetical protein NUV59_02720 [Patescibacteria group bacterium]|nr:hypothetical protein [Patescibacteria group bacterium]
MAKTSEVQVGLNPSTAWSIRQAGNRRKALRVLRVLSEYVGSRERMRKCLRYGREFRGRPEEVNYFRYLLLAKGLIDELYPTARPEKS